MTRKEFIQTMATKTGSSKADMELTVGALLEVLSDTLKKGDLVSFPGFGSFEVRERPAYKGRNPRTDEELQIEASKISDIHGRRYRILVAAFISSATNPRYRVRNKVREAAGARIPF